MAKFSNFPPAKVEVVQPDWTTAPCGQTRDSDALTRANFDAMCDRFDSLDPYGKDWEIVRWPHWELGWSEVVFVRPDSAVFHLAAVMRESMAKFPCIDEDLWVEYDTAENAAKETAAQCRTTNT